MTGQAIPDEAVEAAARVLVWEEYHGLYTYYPEGHPKRDDASRYADKHARAALHAASSIIQAATLESAADAIEEDPYDDLDPFYAGWLRDRARKLGCEDLSLANGADVDEQTRSGT